MSETRCALQIMTSSSAVQKAGFIGRVAAATVVQRMVFSFCSLKDIAAVEQSCKAFKSAVAAPALWASLYRSIGDSTDKAEFEAFTDEHELPVSALQVKNRSALIACLQNSVLARETLYGEMELGEELSGDDESMVESESESDGEDEGTHRTSTSVQTVRL